MAKPRPRPAWRKRPRQERAEATVEALLQATAELLVQGGPEGATTNDIARRAGASIGSLYQYFPNKQALFAELLRRHVLTQRATFERAVAGAEGVSLPAIVGAMVQGILAVQRVNPELHRVLLSHQAQLDPEGLLTQLERDAEAVAAVLLAQMPEQTRIADPELAAAVAVRAVVGVVSRTTERDTARLEDPALEAATVEMLLRYLVR